jgi:TonB-linked SusC/RagA family outer membrane protein
VGDSARRPLDRRVSLDLKEARLEDVLEQINRQADLGLTYTARLVPLDKRVSIHADSLSARTALQRVLEGTGVLVIESSGTVMLVREGSEGNSPEQVVGSIFGTVTDSAVGEPVANVLVTVKGTTLRTSTNARGQYQLQAVPSGVQTVVTRLLGYLPIEKEVTVAESRRVRADFALRHGMTRLQEVITTATGPRRRLELGNDITVLNADSIVKTEPITSVTELLQNRVPGLVVQSTSGAPGDPSRLRLRGASSVSLSNDPIVIVDGVRVYAEQSDRRNGNLVTAEAAQGSFAAPSPVDYIDPNSIETLEVIKGPSAATLYGQDAANGVIVITTKKGRAGPARWTTSIDRARTYIPGLYPEAYVRWGRRVSTDEVVFCPLNNSPGCMADSLVHFQTLNDPELTVLGNGERIGTAVGVSGGSESLTYAINGNYGQEVGVIRLPAFEVGRYLETHDDVGPAGWMRRPQQLTRWGGTSRLSARLGNKADISLTASVSRLDQQRSDLEQQLGTLMTTYVDRATGTYYRPSSPLSTTITVADDLVQEFYTRATDVATQFTNAANLTWRPLGWLTTTGDAGLQVIQRSDETLLPRGALLTVDSVGEVGEGHGNTLMSTLNLRATATAPLRWGMRFNATVGANYTARSIADLATMARDLAPGTSSVAQAATILDITERREEVTTYGWYIEPSIATSRLYVNVGIRLDGGSSFGSRVKLPTFPKLGVSYLISDEKWFPLKSVFNTLRLRAAFGHAGVQPRPDDRLRLYGHSQSWVNGGINTIDTLSTVGNTLLRPERSKEFEGGFDADLLDDRLAIGWSGYRKTRVDALMSFTLPPSVYGNASIMRNIGIIRNTGMEMTVGTQLVRTDFARLSTQLQISQNSNMVVKLGEGVKDLLGTFTQVREGYPLFGYWATPVLGYSDQNGDGIIQSEEVLRGDTAVYMGKPTPDYSAVVNTSLSLFRGALSLTAGLAYDDGFTQNGNGGMLRFLSQAANDPTAPLGDQALVVVKGPSGNSEFGYRETQTISTLRFNNLSVAYNATAGIARRFGVQGLSVALQGTNLGLHTNYRGKDPNVNRFSYGNDVSDSGVLPKPRLWQLRVSVQH